MLKKNDPKTINAWAMYDWANSVYALVIAAAIFPAYYNEVTSSGGSSKVFLFGMQIENTAIYSITLGISFGIVALISPLLSSVADYAGNHKSFMKFFCYTGAAACSALFFFDGTNLVFGLSCLMLATIGYSGSIVYYNGYLPAIADDDMQDKVSAKGYAFGYIGASTLLILNLVFILNQKSLGIEDGTLLPRIAFVTTGIWWFIFAQFTFRKLPDSIYHEKKQRNHPVFHGYQELQKVWRKIKRISVLKIFLFSFFFYIMGVQTVMFMAPSFAEKEIAGIGTEQLIVTVLILEYIGMMGAIGFARISGRIGNINAILIAITVWVFICAGSYFIQIPFHFYIAAIFIGMVMGGIQTLSRSTYSKIIPKTENNAGFFGFYDVCEKTAMMIGLVLFGYLDNLTGSMRNSIIMLGLFFLIGLILMLRMKSLSRENSKQDVV
ncbi:MAG: MFS transporter [Bacteroidota bacterium]